MYDNGTYKVKIVDQSIGENNNGNPELRLTIQPLGIYFDDMEPDGTKKKSLCDQDYPFTRTVFLALTDGTMGTPDQPGWVAHTLKFLGFTGESLSQLDKDHPQHISLIGIEADATNQIENYKGKDREKWNFLRGTGQQQQRALAKDALRQLDAKFGKVLKAVQTAKTNPRPPLASPVPAFAGASRAGEDIPF